MMLELRQNAMDEVGLFLMVSCGGAVSVTRQG